MNLRMITAAAAALGAAVVATAALGGISLKDPKTMVLQKADLPAGAKRLQGGAEKEGPTRHYYVVWQYGAGAKRYQITSLASVMSPRLAAMAFAEARGQAAGEQKLVLPPLGQKQISWFAREDNEGWVWVLRGGTVWSLAVNTGRGNIRLITKRQAAVELKRYAPKQARNVGAG